MARSDKNYPDLYFGRPGQLVKLPYPRGDMARSYEKLSADFLTGAGQHLVSTLLGGSRSYAINWNALHVDTYSKLEQYWTGQMGPGPWALIDPSATNLLGANQASATNVWRDPRDWLTYAGVVQSNLTAAFIHRTGATRSLRWFFNTAAPTTAILEPTAPYRSWIGIPVAPGLPYTWSCWMRADGVVDTSITAFLSLQWHDATGASLSTLDGTPVAVTGWAQKTLTQVAPIGAAYLRPVIVAQGATVTTGGSLYIDEPLLEQDTVTNTWAPGTGVRPVEILGLDDTVPFAARFRKGVTMSLRELAP